MAASDEANMPASAAVWDCHTHIYGPYDRHPLPDGAVYAPQAAPFDVLRAMHRSLGIAHGVIVQAACYGSDHGALLAALDAGDGAYRGIAVIAPDMDETLLAQMAERGVKGVRIGLMSHLGNAFDSGRVRATVERIRPYGWHALVHGTPGDVVRAVEAVGHLGTQLVIDHMARVAVSEAALARQLDNVCALLRNESVWIKVSGVDRITAGDLDAPQARIVLEHLLAVAPTRAIWGTDWPHPNLSYPVPDDRALLGWLQAAAGNDSLLRAVLSENPSRLYG
ncbi:amidohydrolase family protein (plasmid) [Cupriavidus sp. P-10]|uniref:amidohydrolase family protein n=1 Tax=Cupriavidus sp. P-10 TaxID=2027911 RepID=UPI000E2EDC38|nr:amidohydrolase family protein [Cupriavidus sp. P-10]BDB28659.1 amidohydrolase family protein [Cupriavidus sp. P-10]